ncbi:hypothetical protein [uncultured Campylobacter sp.]|uniref:hypothetical protein n=1 Tax=uncultured Campylobacter sp. TaxID=218934 RepID=UPI002604B7FD|nr:hypothetical protein [uncultured Campylobacter sp.]
MSAAKSMEFSQAKFRHQAQVYLSRTDEILKFHLSANFVGVHLKSASEISLKGLITRAARH